MKFTDALVLFCSLAALITPASSSHLIERIFYAGIGVFSCWWNINNLNSLLFGRLCRFCKAIPRCWVDSKEDAKS